MTFLRTIFPTPILAGGSEDVEIRQKICDLAYEFRKTARDASLVSEQWNKGTKSSNPEDFQKKGITSFNSGSLLDKPEWKEVVQFIYSFANTMIQSVNDAPTKPAFINMWTTIYPPGAFVPEHVHSNALLSGVFYAKTPPNCGNIVFKDPASVAKTMFIRKVREFPYVDTRHVYEVKAGSMVIFPAWLPHFTEANESDDDRVIVSFNLNMVDR
ncbi:MAG TPA: TIGR02466 family protein [Polyangiaceae bacterium]|nr:TIGR02466 family protein [Polyangiaceae bacterium]